VRRSRCGSSERAQHAALQLEHLAVIGLVVVAAQVQHAVDDGLLDVGGVLGTDHHVAQLARANRRARPVDGKREDVGGLVLAAVVAVQLADPLLAYQLDRQVPVQAGGAKRCLGDAEELRGGCLDLAQSRFCW
jgi:hypothetical protein